MTDCTGLYSFPPPSITAIPVDGSSEQVPIRRVYCVGRNYADHAREMGADPTAERPFFFQKNPDNLLYGKDFPYPPLSSDVQHEVELAVVLKAGGTNLTLAQAMAAIYGYAVAIDFTRRDLQATAKAKGQPWITGKAFEHSAPISAIVPSERIGHPEHGRIWLNNNGAVVQDGNLNQMIMKPAEIIAELSRLFCLAAGDIILTGTPAGVAPVHKGDKLTCGIDGVAQLRLSVV